MRFYHRMHSIITGLETLISTCWTTKKWQELLFKSRKYPGLENSKYYELAKKYLPKGTGSIFSFDVSGEEAARK